MKPPVTPIFPKSNGPIVPENLPIRKMDPREHILSRGGFNGSYNPEIAHSIHHNHLPIDGHSSNYSGQLPPSTINCINIAQHIDSCPICSRLYDTDKTLYILAIIGLLILCFLMVKRIIKL